MTAQSEGGSHRLKMLGIVNVAFGLVGFPLAFGLAASSPTLSFAIYIIAALFVAVGAVMWFGERLLDDTPEVSA